MKRLRRLLSTHFWNPLEKKYIKHPEGVTTKPDVRYFHCGEYGKQLQHPHHHACIFGWRPPDLTHWSTRDGIKLYRSKTLEELWEYGHSTVGDVTFESAAYVARYVTKKITGSHESYVHPNGDIHLSQKDHYQGKKPEYCTMSRRPGIGDGWIKKYQSDVYPDDHVIINGRPVKAPKFYDKKLELTDPTLYAKTVAKRKERAINDPNNTPDRLAVREKCKLAKAKQLKRGIE